MENLDWQKHYDAFKWAVSRDWKDKNGLHRSIQRKIETLVQEYDLTEKEIIDELLFDYWERAHYQKFNETKGSLNNWIARYVNLYLNHLIRRYAVRAKKNPAKDIDPLDRRNWANLEWIDRDNEKEDLDYQPEIVFWNAVKVFLSSGLRHGQSKITLCGISGKQLPFRFR